MMVDIVRGWYGIRLRSKLHLTEIEEFRTELTLRLVAKIGYS